jgi:dystonin
MLDLDKLGTQLKYFSQKQDAILIKNLLISTQNRWEKIVARSAERTRDLNRGYNEVIQFYESWETLSKWLDSSATQLQQDQSAQIGNNPAKIKQMITKHKEFQKLLGSKQNNYDQTAKLGRKLIDKCEPDSSDRSNLNKMLNELKQKWQSTCTLSVERQKKLEEALLCSGQLHDALQSLIEWFGKVEPTLAETTTLNGDLDSVLALIEDNQQFQQQLEHKSEQVDLVNKAAKDLLNNNDENSNLNGQLSEMNHLWKRVDELSKARTHKLESALASAKEFNAQIRSRLEWLSNAEQMLKYNSQVTLTDNEAEIVENIEIHQNFMRDLQEQELLVKQCATLGQRLLDSCIPEAVINLKHWLAVLHSRWDEICQLSEQKYKRLSEALETCKENESILNELLVWLQGAEATLTALEQKPIANNLEIVEQLLQDHQEFLNDMQSRQGRVERITKSSSIKDADSLNTYELRKKSSSIRTLNKLNNSSNNNSSGGWRTPEPKIRNPRVKILFDRWRKVWLLSLDRQRKLKEAIDRLREVRFCFLFYYFQN